MVCWTSRSDKSMSQNSSANASFFSWSMIDIWKMLFGKLFHVIPLLSLYLITGLSGTQWNYLSAGKGSHCSFIPLPFPSPSPLPHSLTQWYTNLRTALTQTVFFLFASTILELFNSLCFVQEKYTLWYFGNFTFSKGLWTPYSPELYLNYIQFICYNLMWSGLRRIL